MGSTVPEAKWGFSRRPYILPLGLLSCLACLALGACNTNQDQNPAASSSTGPLGRSLVINGGAEQTQSTQVTVDLSATDGAGITAYLLSEDNATPTDQSNWATVTPTTEYQATVTYPLSGLEGQKTLYGWFKNSAGLVSDPTSDQITLSPTAPDTSAPSVSSTSPTNGATGVSTTTAVSVTFSEPVKTESASANQTGTGCTGSLQLSGDGFISCIQMNAAPVASNGDKTFTLTPRSSLGYLGTYKLKVTTGVLDQSGNALAETYSQITGFTTAAAPDTTAPSVVSTSPVDGATGVGCAGAVTVTFSEPMAPASLTTNSSDNRCSGNLQLSRDNFVTCVKMTSATVSSSFLTVTLTPAASLEAFQIYKIKVTTGVTDSSSNPLASNYTGSTGFKTDAGASALWSLARWNLSKWQ